MTLTYKCATEKEFGQFIWGLAGTQKVDEAPTINPDSWAWSSAYQAAHINDTSTTEKAAVQLPVGRLRSGDKITLTVEVMNLSGTKVKIAVDQTTGLTTEDIVRNVFNLQTTKTGEFETIKLTHIVEDDGYYACVVGTFRLDVGEYYIREVKVDVESTTNKPTDTFFNLKKDIRAINVWTSALGVFNREGNFGDDLATITTDSIAKKLTITWVRPFDSVKRPIVVVSADGYLNSSKYFYRAQSATNEKLDILIYDVETNTLQDPTTVLANIFFSVLAVGFFDY